MVGAATGGSLAKPYGKSPKTETGPTKNPCAQAARRKEEKAERECHERATRELRRSRQTS
ncbi:hypothetical protein ASG25_07700 [Rhizobium sp. Leaf384]|nr:hypothetical protein ASG25_07700 [Rhizobium sp. Leaf384]KQS87247.1 hypothetical protein ASG58_03260 [Rhizobium sp. Leaf383]